MGFLNRITALEPFESCPRLLQAAVERFWDGFDLATGTAQRYTGAVYILGYVVEMLLKVGFFRISGIPDNVDVKPYLGTARTHTSWTGRNYHDLQAWCNLLIDARLRRGVQFDPVFAGELTRRVMAVGLHWREDLRYKQSPANDAEVSDVLENADWVLSNCILLWS